MHTSALQARPLLCVSSLAPSQFIQGGAQRLSFGDQDKESTVNNCNVRADAERNVSSKEIAMKIRHILIACVLITGAPLAYADLTCRADSFGNTRCSDGTTYRTDSFGTTRDNRGNTWRTDSFGTTRGSDGSTYRRDSFGTTRDHRGNTWRTDSFGTTRGSNGTVCRTDSFGTMRCN